MGPRLFHALLQRVADAPPESDAELLRRFAATRDEAAFAELVRRYGGLVWGQCRNLLPSEADAEDAFQATFFVLARRPDAVRAAVGPYLHGVAYRVCQNARRLAGRRKRREVASATSEGERPVADSAWDAALAAVHAELHRLPDPQRVAFVLCVLEGRGLTDAAAHLGVKLGTLSARLSRAKQTLMDRLAARGVLAGVAAVATLGGTTAVSATAAERAVQSAVGAAVVPDVVHALTHGVTTMATKFKLLAAAVLLATGLGLGVGSGWVATAQEKPTLLGLGARLKAEDERRQRDLEAEVRALSEALQKAQAELERKVKPAAPTPEFRYVHLSENDSMSMTKQRFEKAVKAHEADGYLFVGEIAIRTEEPLEGGSQAAAVPTLVFRKKPADKLTAEKDIQDYQQRVWLRYQEQKQAELPLKEQREPLAAQKAQLEAQANLARAMEEKLRAEIAALEDQLKKHTGAPATGAAGAKPEKLYAVNFDNVPWPKVAELLAKENGLTLVGDVAPQGNCTIKLDGKVPIGEVMDLFNEILAQQKMTFIRGEQTLRYWPTDKPLPQLFVPSVSLAELPKRGKSEVVQVVLPLGATTAEDAEKLAKKLKSPVGEVTVLGRNQLAVRDRAGEVRAISAAIQK